MDFPDKMGYQDRPLSARIGGLLTSCKKCHGTGSYDRNGDEYACLICTDILTILDGVTLLEQIARVAFDCRPWLSEDAQKYCDHLRKLAGMGDKL